MHSVACSKRQHWFAHYCSIRSLIAAAFIRWLLQHLLIHACIHFQASIPSFAHCFSICVSLCCNVHMHCCSIHSLIAAAFVHCYSLLLQHLFCDASSRWFPRSLIATAWSFSLLQHLFADCCSILSLIGTCVHWFTNIDSLVRWLPQHWFAHYWHAGSTMHVYRDVCRWLQHASCSDSVVVHACACSCTPCLDDRKVAVLQKRWCRQKVD